MSCVIWSLMIWHTTNRAWRGGGFWNSSARNNRPLKLQKLNYLLIFKTLPSDGTKAKYNYK
jgi:hypothetical protein